MYASGRLQKPVYFIKRNKAVDAAIAKNKKSAICVALLLLPKVSNSSSHFHIETFCILYFTSTAIFTPTIAQIFREIDLYLSIASLSYIGDPRMLYGENPRKVINLVTPIVPLYRETYREALATFTSREQTGVHLLRYIEDDAKNTLYSQDVSVQSRWGLAQVIQSLELMLCIAYTSPPSDTLR